MRDLPEAAVRFLAERLSGPDLGEFWITLASAEAEARAARRAARLALTSAHVVSIAPMVETGQVTAGLPVEKSPVSVPGHFRKDSAMRGLLLSRAVSKSAKAVGVHLIDCCTLLKGSYEVGVGTIAGRLRLSERSVRRAASELDELGLIAREVHAGRNHINGYRPDWEALARAPSLPVKADKTGQTGQNRPKLSANTESPSPTYSLLRKPQRMREPDRAQREMMLPRVLEGGKAAPGPAAIAREHAGVRVMQALNRHLAGKGDRFAERTKAEIAPELFEAAVVAEVRLKGSGIVVLKEGLGPGPPGAVPEVSDSLRAVLKRG